MKTKQQSNVLLLRMLFLLAMVLTGTGVSWGQTSYGKAEINAAPTSDTDWQCITDQGDVKAWYKGTSNENGSTYGGVQIDNKWFVKLSGDGFIKIRVAKGTVSVGDILRVEVAKFYDNSDAATLGFKVNGSNGTVYKSNVTDRSIYTLDYVLKAGDINLDSDDTNYDYIQFNRGDTYGTCAYHSVEILTTEGFIVTFGPNTDGWGTVTAKRTDTDAAIASGEKVPNGTQVQFTATPASDYLTWGWNVDGADNWSFSNPYTVTKDVTIKHNFTPGIKINAYTNNANYGTVSIANGGKNATQFHVTPWPGDVTFTATPTANGQFVGWYSDVDCNTLVTSEPTLKYTNDNSELQSAGTINRWAKFIEIPKKTIGKPFCNHAPDHANGDNYFNIQQLNAGTGVTIEANATEGRDVTVPATGGYMSFFFDNTYNLSDLSAWTISGNTDLQARVNSVEFIGGDDGTTSLANCYTDAGNRGTSNGKTAIDADLQAKLKKVKEIRIHFKSGEQQTYNFTWIRFSFTHADHSARPVLTEGTAEDMRIFAGEDLTLANNAGFWRQYSDNSFANDKIINTLIPTNEWKSKYVIPASSLAVNTDYYFGVKDDMTCALGYNHHSDLVGVHVKVVEPIKTVDVKGTTRQYDVYAPDGITGTVGVVISLHGASNDYWNGRVDFNTIADNEKTTDKKFVVVYPRGLMRQLRGTERGWESYTESNTEDVDFFKEIVKELKKTYTVDDSRIYLAGFSNGGMMAYKAAHQAGDFFKAFASVGGYPVNESHLYHAGVQPTPFIHIQGKADTVFPDGTYPLSVVAHNMMFRNGAIFTPAGDGNGVITPHLSNVEEDCHNAGVGGAAFYMYKVANMGHTWTYDWNNDGKDDIAETMWKFFTKDGLTNNLDKSLKFNIYDPSNFWSVITTGKASGEVQVGYIGFDNVDTGTSVLSYGGYTKTDNSNATYNKDTNNKNLWHSLQFQGAINGANHYLKLNVETNDVGGTANEKATDFFLVKLTKTGSSTPVFAKRYQAGRGTKDLYINFSALPGWNEYKLEITKSSADLVVKVHGIEAHSGKCQDVGQEENPVFFYNVEGVLDGMNPIYQPVFDKSYDGIAKEYLPIANIPVGGDPKTIEDNLKVSGTPVASIPSTLVTSFTDHTATTSPTEGKMFFNIAKSNKPGEDSDHKENNACILGAKSYKINDTKGICISQYGRAKMPEYLNGTRATFPEHGVMAIKFQGTCDFFLLAHNELDCGTDAEAARRTLKVYYTNDQLSGELKELKEWDFYGMRSEININDEHNHTYGLQRLNASIRLPQLGQDGTCTVVISYEGDKDGSVYRDVDSDKNESGEYDKVWIKGFVIKRPDLKVTIGRTDNLYAGKKYTTPGSNPDVQDNTFCTHFGENKPYVWSFENVGFNNTKNADLNKKKINIYDGRTYVCGGVDSDADHLLVFSDPTVTNDVEADKERKAQFDGITAGDEHIEFRKQSVYHLKDLAVDATGRKDYTPVESNGIKVNVTGSGWFKIRAAAPNGPVKMKVYASTNYGASYLNLLREFTVNTKGMSNADINWQDFTVYYKARVDRDGSDGYWDGTPTSRIDENENPEEVAERMRMSLYIVFDEIANTTYDEGHPQLNIHELSWLNEIPMDYVFQREENPDLLTELQTIRRFNANGEQDYDKDHSFPETNKENVVLRWQASNPTIKETLTLNGDKVETFDCNTQKTTEKGVKSYYGKATTYHEGYTWDIAATPAVASHTEVAQHDEKGYKYDAETTYKVDAATVAEKKEFGLPISGSFYRLYPEKNGHVIAYVIPTVAEQKVYVLDETGAPVEYLNNSDLSTQSQKARGGVKVQSGGNQQTDNTYTSATVTDGTGTIRLDLLVSAGKEYFICGSEPISLAALHWYQTRGGEATAATLNNNGDNNAAVIDDAKSAQGEGDYTGTMYRNVNLNRDFTANQWASLVLPFSMNELKFKEVFGENAICIHFDNIDLTTNTVNLVHHYYNMIVAGRPVFVRPSKNVSAADIKDVTLQAGNVISTTDKNGVIFNGNINKATMPANSLFVSDNAIKHTTKAKEVNAMRAWIEGGEVLKNINASNAAPVARLINYDGTLMDEDMATGIETALAESGMDAAVISASTVIYNLQGNKVATGAELNNLPAGVYVVKGKKFIVK